MNVKLLAALLVVPALAIAEGDTIYTWEDRNGVSHYTDAPAQVPSDARRVRRLKLERPAATKPAASAEPPSPPAPRVGSSPVSVRDARVWQDTSGLDEAQWRDRFVEAHRRIKSVETRLRAAQELRPAPYFCNECPAGQCAGAQPQCVPNPEFERVQTLVAQLTGDLQDAKNDLEQLDRNATLASVPREWRRGW